MLNISENSIKNEFKKHQFSIFERVEGKKSGKIVRRLILWTMVLAVIIMFLPWTQNIRSSGQVTTLKPDQRPQTIHSVIGGRIEKWYVQEGDLVKKGDTIAFISEVKADYFDPLLLDRTASQTDLKKQTAGSYAEKVTALDNQISALTTQLNLKLEQGKIKLQQSQLKVTNDSIALDAARVNFKTADEQYQRMKDLYQQGLKSLTDLENREVKMQNAYSYLINAENKFLASKSEYISTKIELGNIQLKYETDVAKAKSDKFSALSNKLDSEGQVTKLENQYSNYQKRNEFYYITAPQDCYITKLVSTGIGETIKEGAPLVHIMPSDYDLAVEIYVEPIDLPLLSIGRQVRIQFDGWPAIVFSGWPNASYGTYGGVIYGIDQYISPNGKFRVLVKPDPNDHPWPEALKYGGGTNSIILLDDVPIGYELWRKVNGFPPNYYDQSSAPKTTKK